MQSDYPITCTVHSTNNDAHNTDQPEVGNKIYNISDDTSFVITDNHSIVPDPNTIVNILDDNVNDNSTVSVDKNQFCTATEVIQNQMKMQSNNSALNECTNCEIDQSPNNNNYNDGCPKSTCSTTKLTNDLSNGLNYSIDAYNALLETYRSPAPFSHDSIAQKTNADCDYSIKITAEMARSGNAPRQVRVYADGVYDVFHSGHSRQLMQAKCAFPKVYLIVGVAKDADVRQYKGRTVMNEKERYETVRHCRYVDEVLCGAPWTVTNEFLQAHKIDFVAHDDLPYSSPDSEDIYKPLKEAGMFVVTQRTEGISTTDVIGRIVRDYDVYLRRNIRRGLSRKDLNISYMKEQSLKIQDNLETMMKRGSSLIQNFDSKRREFVDQLEDMSHEVVRSFMRIFGAEGPLRHWLAGKKRKMSHSSNTVSALQIDDDEDDDEEDYDDDDDDEFGESLRPAKLSRLNLIYNSGSSSPHTDLESNTSTNQPESGSFICGKNHLIDPMGSVNETPILKRSQRRTTQKSVTKTTANTNARNKIPKKDLSNLVGSSSDRVAKKRLRKKT